MVAREVSKELKQQLHPLLREWGFTDLTARSARIIDGPITITIQIGSVTKRFHDVTGIPLGSFGAEIGIDYGHASGAGFLRRELLIHDQMSLRAALSRTPAMPDGGRSDIWFPDVAYEAEAVADMVQAFRTQGRAFVDEWTNLDSAYANLLRADLVSFEGEIGVAGLMVPGNPGSTNRLSNLAVLAALRNDEPAERAHLAAYLEQTEHPWVLARIDELDGAG